MVFDRPMVLRTCAVALALFAAALVANPTSGQSIWMGEVGQPFTNANGVVPAAWVGDATANDAAQSQPVVGHRGAWEGTPVSPERYDLVQATPVSEEWIAAPAEHQGFGSVVRASPDPALSGSVGRPATTYGYAGEPAWGGRSVVESFPSSAWYWQVLPDGLIYRSYQAGAHEPRLSIVAFHEADGRSLWDGTLGGRVGLVRYGTGDGLYPHGWQLDVEAAAIVRLTLDEIRDFETADYRVGIPLTYGIDNWQFKFAVYHLSSHLGDEFAIANPGSLDDRINYVRDAVVLGASYYPHPMWRVYSEAAYAVNVDGGAEPWEFQLGTEVSRPGPTGPHGTPFLAMNAHLREEHNFGGDITTQAGWLWRGHEGQVVRLGVHYFNGKSSQYQTFDDSEQQIGFGMWYDF
jgi:hypothetical protein